MEVQSAVQEDKQSEDKHGVEKNYGGAVNSVKTFQNSRPEP